MESNANEVEGVEDSNRGQSATKIGWRSLALIFLLAVSMRGLVLFELSGTPFFSLLFGDALGYHVWAEGLAAGDWLGSEVFYQAPLYPYSVGILYSLFGTDPLVVKLAQMLLEGLSCVMLAGAAARFFESKNVGLLAGGLAAVHAPAIFFVGLLQKATLGFFFTSLVLDLVSRLDLRDESRRPGWLLLGLGAALGLLALTRENALVFIPLVAIWLVVSLRGAAARRIAAWVALLLLGTSIPLGSVGLRNRLVGGEFALTTSQFGTNFFIGNNANAEGFYLPLRQYRGHVRYERDDAVDLAEEALGRPLTPGEVSTFWTGKAFEYIREDPVDWVALMLRKAALVWNRIEASDTEDIAVFRHYSILLDGLARLFNFGVIVPLGAAGLWLTRRRWRDLWLLHAMIVTYAASLTIFFLFARYRVPLIPLSLLFAAAGARELVGLAWEGDARTRWQTMGVVLFAAIVSNLPLTDTDKQMAATYKNFGGGMLESQKYPEAIGFFEKSLVYSPGNRESKLGVAQALAYLGRFDESRERFEGLVESSAGDHQALLGLGQVALRQGDVDQGLRMLEAATRNAPSDDRAYFLLGMHHAQAGDLGLAIPWLRAAAEREEAHEARLELAKALYRTGDARRAQLEASSIIERDPKNLAALLLLGSLLEEDGRLGPARSLFEQALLVAPDSVTAGQGLKRIDRKLGSNERLRRVEARLASNPDDVDARLALSRVHGEAGRWADAETQLRRAIDLDSSRSVLYLELGFILGQRGLRSQAVEAFETALALDPENPNVEFHLGRLAELEEDRDAARGHYERALGFAPDHARSRAALVRIEAEEAASPAGRDRVSESP